jgi:GMP synthase-like glutamine amidotransferase
MSDVSRNRVYVARVRDRMRAMGLRPVQIWVPDTTAPGFADEARRQSLIVGSGPEARDAQDWIDANSIAADLDE